MLLKGYGGLSYLLGEILAASLVLFHSRSALYWWLWVLPFNPLVFLTTWLHVFVPSCGCIIFVLCYTFRPMTSLLHWPFPHFSPVQAKTQTTPTSCSPDNGPVCWCFISSPEQQENVMKEIFFDTVRCRVALPRVIHNPAGKLVGGGAWNGFWTGPVWHSYLSTINMKEAQNRFNMGNW